MKIDLDNIEKEQEKIIKYVDEQKDSEYRNEIAKQMLHNAGFTSFPKKWYVPEPGGVKCDGLYCDWKRVDMPLEDMYLWRNCPCPKCGANVFIDKDWSATVALNMIVGNPIIRFINWFSLKLGQKSYKYRVEIKEGKFTFNKVNISKEE